MATVLQRGRHAKNLGGRPERTIAVPESVLLKFALASEKACSALVELAYARQDVIDASNRGKARA